MVYGPMNRNERTVWTLSSHKSKFIRADPTHQIGFQNFYDETYVSFDSNDNSIGSASEIPTQKSFVYFVGNRVGPRVDPWGATNTQIKCKKSRMFLVQMHRCCTSCAFIKKYFSRFLKCDFFCCLTARRNLHCLILLLESRVFHADHLHLSCLIL
jgi:hypothetical protein